MLLVKPFCIYKCYFFLIILTKIMNIRLILSIQSNQLNWPQKLLVFAKNISSSSNNTTKTLLTVLKKTLILFFSVITFLITINQFYFKSHFVCFLLNCWLQIPTLRYTFCYISNSTFQLSNLFLHLSWVRIWPNWPVITEKFKMLRYPLFFFLTFCYS